MKTVRLVLIAVMILLPGAAVRGDVVTDWNSLTMQLIRDTPVGNLPASRTMAMVSTAMFDAVNSVNHDYQPYRVNTAAAPGTSAEAAAASAAHRILSTLYPTKAATFDTLYNSQLAAIANGAGKTNGIALGQAVADNIQAWRSTDNSAAMGMYMPGTDPGDWRPTPPGNLAAAMPQWRTVTPFVMTSGSQFRQAGPPTLTSATYTADYNETQSLGGVNSATRTQWQTETARFYADMPGKNSPFTQWNQVAQTLSASKGFTLAENARLFAVLDTAMADGAIAAWDMKYYYDRWRPVTAIQAGDTDGNPATIADAAWMPLITTPNFQEYISTHSLVYATAAEILALFNGSDDFTFTLTSEMDPLLAARTFDTFSACADEAGRSRIYAGLHFEFSNQDGLAAGRQLAAYAYANEMTPVPEPATLTLLGLGLFTLAARRRKA